MAPTGNDARPGVCGPVAGLWRVLRAPWRAARYVWLDWPADRPWPGRNMSDIPVVASSSRGSVLSPGKARPLSGYPGPCDRAASARQAGRTAP